MKSKTALFAENITESACSCLLMMVQGNLLLVSLGHWLVAMETGVIAGTIASFLLVKGRTAKPWVISAVLGGVTACVDFFVHSGRFISVITEAALTGVGAAILSLIVEYVVKYALREIGFIRFGNASRKRHKASNE